MTTKKARAKAKARATVRAEVDAFVGSFVLSVGVRENGLCCSKELSE
jgi:hypothetical protein